MQGRSVRPLFRRLAVPVSLLRPILFGFAEIRVGIFSLLSFEQLPLIAMWSCLTVTCIVCGAMCGLDVRPPTHASHENEALSP
jgi:hypothetical protein